MRPRQSQSVIESEKSEVMVAAFETLKDMEAKETIAEINQEEEKKNIVTMDEVKSEQVQILQQPMSSQAMEQ